MVGRICWLFGVREERYSLFISTFSKLYRWQGYSLLYLAKIKENTNGKTYNISKILGYSKLSLSDICHKF